MKFLSKGITILVKIFFYQIEEKAMLPNESEIFREATRHICGNIDFESSMMDCLNYLRKFMPADCFHLTLLDRGLGLLKTIAIATPDEAKRVNIIISLDNKGRAMVNGHQYIPSLIMGPVEYDSLREPMIQKAGIWEEHSVMLVQLTIKHLNLGNLILFAKGNNRFTEEHLRIFSMLKEPFAMALLNSLRYDELGRMREIIAKDLKQSFSNAGDGIVGDDIGLHDVMELVKEVAPLNSPVLIQGETGTGKEIIAKTIHKMSRRNNGPFIEVNCGAISETLIDSELFGHEKGSFTGAIAQKKGCFERANGGTIFLDEVAELPLQAQVRMLRVLQEREIIRVGGSNTIKVDIRIIAATHKDLGEMVEKGSFRPDLHFRLNVFPIVIPPLRDRQKDIQVLVNHFVEKKSRELMMSGSHILAPGSIDLLTSYQWPGNVRELENVVERALILSKDGILHFENILSPSIIKKKSASAYEADNLPDLDSVASTHIRQALKVSKGRINGPGGAADILGLNPNTLRHRMRKLGIPFGKGKNGTPETLPGK
jgi:transcriptional regulator with GAF, ATPase, and Fis domain